MSKEKTCIVCGHSLSVHLDTAEGWRCHSLGADLYQCECFQRELNPLFERQLKKNEKGKNWYWAERRIKEHQKEFKEGKG